MFHPASLTQPDLSPLCRQLYHMSFRRQKWCFPLALLHHSDWPAGHCHQTETASVILPATQICRISPGLSSSVLWEKQALGMNFGKPWFLRRWTGPLKSESTTRCNGWWQQSPPFAPWTMHTLLELMAATCTRNNIALRLQLGNATRADCFIFVHGRKYVE